MSRKDRRPPGAKSKYEPMVDALAELKRLEKAQAKAEAKPVVAQEKTQERVTPDVWPTASYGQQAKIADNLCKQWNLGLSPPRYFWQSSRADNQLQILDTQAITSPKIIAIFPVLLGTWPDQPNYVDPSQLKDLEPPMAISPIYFLAQRPTASRTTNQANAADQELISKLRAKLKEQDEALTVLTEPAQTFGIVTANCGDTVEVLTERGATLLANPPGLALAEGMYVTLSGATGQILGEHRPAELTIQGEIVTFVEYEAPSLRCICKRQGGDLLLTPFNRYSGLQPGDRLQLDIFNRSVLQRLPKPAQAPLPTFKSVSWSEVGGNAQAKAELREAISLLRSNSELAQAYDLRLPRGILFYGPPGCGKTLLGRAAATELSDGRPGAFVYIKGPGILSKFVGDAEGTVRQLFQSAKDYFADTGQRQLIFIDEAEAILGRRGTGLSSDMEKTIVPTFLTEMDGLSETAALVILATNRPDALDPAIIRDGRVDRRICVERPDFDTGQEILRINLDRGPLAPDQDLADLTALATELIYIGEPSLHSHLSGAFLEGFVERARRHAYRQDLATGLFTGIAAHHLHSALADLKKEYF